MKKKGLNIRRRLKTPPKSQPRSPLKLVRLNNSQTILLQEDIKKLAKDPEWEAVEVRIVDHVSKHFPQFEE
jgi:hypothetical protein